MEIYVMINDIAVADKVLDELMGMIFPDSETLAMYKLRHGFIPVLENYIGDGDNDSFNCIEVRVTTSNWHALNEFMNECWALLQNFPGECITGVRVDGAVTRDVIIHNDVVFFRDGLGIVYCRRRSDRLIFRLRGKQL